MGRRRISHRRTVRRELDALRARLNEAEETLRALRAGEVDAIVVSDADEDRIYTLRGEDHSYRILIETMSEGALTLLADGTIVYCNAQFAALVRAPLAQTIGTPLQRFVAPPDQARFAQLLAGRGGEGDKAVLKLLSGEGTLVPVQISLRAIFGDDAGSLCAVVTDLSDRLLVESRMAASLREKELLLQEVHHRVKNNLQVIASLLRIQAATLDDPRIYSALQDSQNRIRAMVLMHEQLYRVPDLSQVNAASYLHQIIMMVLSSLGWGDESRQLLCDFDDTIALDPDTAIPLGLIVTELISNCIKHAFVGRSGGMIEVTLRRDGAGISLAVADDGIGMGPGPRPQDGATMGLQLVDSLAVQVSARLTFADGPGTRVEICMPGRVR